MLVGYSEKVKGSLVESVWQAILSEAEAVILREYEMKNMVRSAILSHKNLDSTLAYRLAQKLSTSDMRESVLNKLIMEAYEANEDLIESACLDIIAVRDRDPACHRFIDPLLYYKGFIAVQSYRVGSFLNREGYLDLSYFLQMRSSEVFGVDIHPNAHIGNGIMIDHAHSIVIGETAIVGRNVSMLHSVTLGGTGKDKGDRHPKIGDGVLLGAGASVLGNITVGRCCKVASGSVVLSDVPDYKTVAGVPAKVVGHSGCDQPSSLMDQNIQ